MSERTQTPVFAKTHWMNMARRLRNPENHLMVYRKLEEIYISPERRYHNLKHIVHMLDALETYERKDQDYTALQLAIWYHDAVYDSKADDNELQSAIMCKLHLEKLKLNEQLIDRIVELIMVTTHTGERFEDESLRIMVDLDLLILGSRPLAYSLYEEGIRAEYAWMPDDEFDAKQKELLENFLARPSIFQTDFFKKKFEHIAQDNIQRSLAKLPVA